MTFQERLRGVEILGLSAVWVNRREGREGFGATVAPRERAEPDLEVPDLKTLVPILL